MWEWIEGETGEEVDGPKRDWMEEDKVEAEEGTVEQEGEEDGLLGGGKLKPSLAWKWWVGNGGNGADSS